MSDCTEQSFLKDVAKHEMIVLREEGVYRHVRFSIPGDSCYRFDIITWPGYLCYTGDMGTYVFRRLEDMFQFFRTDRDYGSKAHPERQLHINKQYWAEKLIAIDSNGRRGSSATEFSPSLFRQIVKEQLVEWFRERELNKADRRELRDAIQQDVLDVADDGEALAYDAANEFRISLGGRVYAFNDFWDNNLSEYTYHFTWCCYALAWGIQQYDNAKGEQ